MEKVSMSARFLHEMANSTEVVGREQIEWAIWIFWICSDKTGSITSFKYF